MTARRLLTAAFLVAFAAAPAPAQTVSELVSARGRSTSPFAAVVAKAGHHLGVPYEVGKEDRLQCCRPASSVCPVGLDHTPYPPS